ncbi:MAG: hypothetical protein ACE5E1_10980 [Phycisphaerae bacterium]
MKKNRLSAFLLLASTALLTGCSPASVGAVTFGSALWLDIALTPIRSLLGGAALNLVNTL